MELNACAMAGSEVTTGKQIVLVLLFQVGVSDIEVKVTHHDASEFSLRNAQLSFHLNSLQVQFTSSSKVLYPCKRRAVHPTSLHGMQELWWQALSRRAMSLCGL